MSNPKPTVLFLFCFKGRGNLRGSFFMASNDRIYMINWIFFFHHFPACPVESGDESDEYKTINFYI